MRQIEKEDVQNIIYALDESRFFGKTFLITGSTGALARYCVMTLMELSERNPTTPCKVVVLCRNVEKAKRIWVDYLTSPNFVLMEGRVEDKIEYQGEIDYIFHAACISATQYFHTNPVEIISANAIGTYNLLMLAREKEVKGFLFFSSGAVYGGTTKDNVTYNGLEPLDYKNCYNMSKRLGENLCASFVQEYGVPAKVLRIGYTYGPHIDLKDGHLYSDFIKAIIERRDLVIRSDGQARVGMTYITDAVIAFFQVLLQGRPDTPYVMHNDDEQMTIEELAAVLTMDVFPERKLKYMCLEKKKEKEPEPIIKYSSFLQELGWKVQIKMADGFFRTVMCLEETN